MTVRTMSHLLAICDFAEPFSDHKLLHSNKKIACGTIFNTDFAVANFLEFVVGQKIEQSCKKLASGFEDKIHI